MRPSIITRSKKSLAASVLGTSSQVQVEPNIQQTPACTTKEGGNRVYVNYVLNLSSMNIPNYVSCIAVDVGHNECPNQSIGAAVDNQNEETHGATNSPGMSLLM